MRRTLTRLRRGWWLLFVARAASAEGSGGPVTFRECAPREAKEIARLVAIDRVAHPEVASPTNDGVSVTCRGGRFDVQVTGAHGAVLDRSLDLQNTPAGARMRFVAIAIAELSAADQPGSQAAPAVSSPPARPSLRDETAPLAVSSSTSSKTPVRLEVEGSARLFKGGEALFGGGLRAALPRDLPLAVDLLVEYGSRGIDGGSVGMLVATAGVTFGYSRRIGTMWLRGAAGVRGGVASLRGRPGEASDVVAAASTRGWGGPMAQGSVALAEGGGVVLEALIEGGYALFPVYALVDDNRQAGLHGVWAGAMLAIGLQPN